MDFSVDPNMPILKKNRLSSGIYDLDLVLEGGYLNPGSIMIIGPSGMEKTIFYYQFISAVDPSEAAIVICAHTSPDDIINKAATHGLDLKKKNIFFVDCYSQTIGKVVQGTDKIKVVQSPGALNDLSLVLNEFMRTNAGKKLRVSFDTLSTFVLYNSPDSMRRFLGVIQGRLNTAGATTLYLVDEGVHDKQLLSLIEQGMDALYTLTDTGGRFVLSIPEIEIPLPLKIGPAGISIV